MPTVNGPRAGLLHRLGRFRGVLGWGISLLLLALVGQQLHKQWGALEQDKLTFSVGWGALSLAGLGAFMVSTSDAWRRLMLGLGQRLSPRDAFYVMFVSNLAKYLPGGVWTVVGRIGLAQMRGTAPASTFLSVLLETALQLTAAGIVVLASLPFYSASPLLAQPVILALPVGLAVLLVHPRVLDTGLGLVQRLTKRDVPRLTVSYAFLLRMLGQYTVNWLLLGASFAALGRVLLPGGFGARDFMVLVGSFSLAWNVGVFAFFLPGGVGVREAALVMVLGRSFPPAWAAALAIAARIWMTVGEIGCFGAAVMIGGSARIPTVHDDSGPER
jgi:glycosyltransferase 2 family protein